MSCCAYVLKYYMSQGVSVYEDEGHIASDGGFESSGINTYEELLRENSCPFIECVVWRTKGPHAFYIISNTYYTCNLYTQRL